MPMEKTIHGLISNNLTINRGKLEMQRKVIHVVCLVLVDLDGFFYTTQRPEEKNLALHWEFPGGKVEPNEDPEHALRREIEEELNWSVEGLERLPDSLYQYEFGTICLTPFLHRCSERPELILTEHKDSCWVDSYEWRDLLWAPADIPIINNLLGKAVVV